MIPRRGTPVVGPDGTSYKSVCAAARALGFHQSTVRHHLITYGNLDLLGVGTVACIHNGVRYPSLQACADALGVARNTLTHHLNTYGNLDRAGIGRPRGNPGNKGRRVVTRIGPMEWARRMDAAADLQISRTSLSRWLGPRATPQQRERLMALAMQAHARRCAASWRGAV